MGQWKKRNLYIKVLNNSFDNMCRISEVQDKPFCEDEEIEPIDDRYYAETEYEVEIDNDISRDEAEFIEGFYSDYEDFDSVEYEEIDLSNYEMSKEDVNEYYDDEDEYDENYIYLNGGEIIRDGIDLNDVIEQIDIKNFCSKPVIVIKNSRW